MLNIGLDEAGYGPVIGPLAVVAAAADTGDPAAFAAELAALGVADSKRVHASGDLARLERVALPGLAWLTGQQPASAAAVFDLLGGTAAERAPVPWQAVELPVPVAASGLIAWRIAAGRPAGVAGRLLQPRQLNAARLAGRNRAQAELDAVSELLRALHPDPDRPAEVVADRLGGRTRYAGLLTGIWGRPVETVDEAAAACRYRVGATAVGFVVGGESASILVALASCIAKYARELHMELLNRWWSGRLPGLAPTAGYPQDARRWLTALPPADLAAWRHELVREPWPPA
jgi:ribonuclease HII